jgi:hypothetical protein
LLNEWADGHVEETGQKGRLMKMHGLIWADWDGLMKSDYDRLMKICG